MDLSIEKLKNNQKITVREIRELFRQRRSWREDLYADLAKRALDMGENFYAYDIAEKITPVDEKSSWQKLHIMALALARSGSLDRAAELLGKLPDSDNSEIVGLRSRILKDMAVNTRNKAAAQKLFEQAAELSLTIFQKKKQYYNGINAAACLMMAGKTSSAQTLVSQEVLPLCQQITPKDLWLIATIAECHLLLGNIEQAADNYRQAAEIAVQTGQLGSFASTLKQFYMLAENFEQEQIQMIVRQMNLPCIAIFSGHMIDRPNRSTPRFPAYAEAQVRKELSEIIKNHNIRIAYCSCACGGDIIFIEEVLKNNGDCFILPPLPLPAAIKNSVDIIPGADWEQRLNNILKNENSVLLEAECDEIGVEDDCIVYEFTNQFLFGAAIHRSHTLHFPLLGVTVWNREKSNLPGGTDSAVSAWEEKGLLIEIVTPEIKK